MSFAGRLSLHIPFPDWAKRVRDVVRDFDSQAHGDFENWKELERWADRLLASGTLSSLVSAGSSFGKTSNQSIPHNTVTPITFDDEDFDDGFHETATPTRFTVPAGEDGRYLLIGVGEYSVNSTGIRQVAFRKNGTTANLVVSRIAALAGFNTYVTAVIVTELAVGDYVELYGFQTSGGSLNILGGVSGETIVSITKTGRGD